MCPHGIKDLLLRPRNYHARFDVEAVANRRAPIRVTVDVPKVESLGEARLRLLAYDLMVLLNIVRTDRNLPRFLVHDGAFASVAARTRQQLLNFVHRQSQVTPDMQYIVTANEDELKLDAAIVKQLGKVEFDWQDCVIANYEDEPSKMLFHREYGGRSRAAENTP